MTLLLGTDPEGPSPIVEAPASVPGDLLPRRLQLAFSLVLLLLPLGVAWFGFEIVEGRRILLVRNIESEARRMAVSVSGIVRERARNLAEDLSLTGDLIEADADDVAAIRAHMVALDRTNRSYLQLWYMRDGEVRAEARENRPSLHGVPPVAAELLQSVQHLARSHPGKIVRGPASNADESDYRFLRLFALAPNPGEDVVVVLVGLDALFDTLQKRARLPGSELWVVDTDGTPLIDPEDSEEVTAHLGMDQASGTAVVGAPGGVWPWSDTTVDARVVAWRRVSLPTFAWTTAVALPLRGATTELRELTAQAMLVFVSACTIVGAVLTVLWWYSRRQRHLQERVDQLSTVNRLRDQLIRAERLSTFGQLAAGLAHEIGTPLGVIALRLDQLLERDEEGPERERLVVMREQIDRIGRIIRQLLDFGRAQPAQMGPVSVATAVGRVATLIEHRFERRRLRLELGVADDIVVRANLDQLHQVLLNLLVNATDAAKTVVEVAATSSGEHVLIEVLDDGPGVEADTTGRIFDAFYTTKPPGEGTGLGLTICRDLVEAHGGHLSVNRTDGRTCFSVRWPSGEPT